MKIENLIIAEAEARRFLQRIKELKAVVKAQEDIENELCWGSRRTGAIKRASLDLSMALADLRNK